MNNDYFRNVGRWSFDHPYGRGEVVGFRGRAQRAGVRIGDNTQGVFSDMLVRQLPNGWTFAVPNEEYLTPAGTTDDGTGIPPDIHTPVFGDELSTGQDSAFDRAVAELHR